MRWISAQDLEDWARGIPARFDLPELVADLIRATASNIDEMRFPSGDKGAVRGFDGHLVATSAALNIPEGRSYWEFGTNDYKSKLLEDFKSRTKDVDEAQQADITLVLVTPWTWDSSDIKNKIEDWEALRAAESKWKAVKVVDGSKLADWLETCPAVASWHARVRLKLAPATGARSADEFWDEYAGLFKRPITEEVLLCERLESAERLLETLMGAPSSMTLQADSPDEVVAFAVAAIRQAPPAVRFFLQARTLIVDTVEAARFLAPKSGLLLILRGEAGRSPSQFSAGTTTLVPLGRQQKLGANEILPRPTAQALGKALMSMGWEENEALTLARGSGRSLTALSRLRPGGNYDPPGWVAEGAQLLPAILAGGWNRANDLDKAAVEKIAHSGAYRDLEARLRTHLTTAEPPFETVGSVWTVRAPMDAFMWAGQLIGPEEAERFRQVLIDVFGAIEPDPDPDEPLSFGGTSPSGHTEWLREGLATTLLMMAVWWETAGVNLAPDNGQTFADRVVEDLPGLKSDYRLLTSLQRELPLLAEAAPVPLLSALEHMLGGMGELIAPIFKEIPGYLTPSFRHVGVMWALEVLAWDPAYFRRAVLVLARLEMLAPEGRMGNRPIGSLQEIFLLWNPSTNAPLALRMAVLEELTQVTPEVGWKVLVALLPSNFGSSMATQKPRLREAGAADRKPITRREYAEAQSAVIGKVLALVGDDAARWNSVLPVLSLFDPVNQHKALAALEGALGRLTGQPQRVLWERVRREVERHERFSTAKWALGPDQLVALQDLVARFEPGDPMVQVKWMFETWALDGSGDLADSDRRRARAVEAFYRSEGAQGLLRLAASVRGNYMLAHAVEAIGLPADELLGLVEASLAAGGPDDFTYYLSGAFRRQAGPQKALEWLEAGHHANRFSGEVVARFLLAWPDGPATWTVARRFGPEVETGYWTTRSPHYTTGPRSALLRSSLLLTRHGRPLAALQSALNRLDELPSKLLVRMIGASIRELNSGADHDGTMLRYYLEEGFNALDGRSDVPEEEIVKLEFGLLPLLADSGRALKLYDLMARSAGVYHNILCDVFRAVGDPPGEPDAVTQSRARISYSLLREFDKVPGQADGDIDAAALSAWVDDLRLRGKATDREEITDIYLGHVLAHAVADPDGAWPHRAVRYQIERIASVPVERGIQTQRFNMRGVFTKGVMDGGEQERDIAHTYSEAAATTVAWPRTSALLSAMARHWEEYAKHADLDLEQRRLKY